MTIFIVYKFLLLVQGIRCRSAPYIVTHSWLCNGGISGSELSSLVAWWVYVCIQFNFDYLSQFVLQHSVCVFLENGKKKQNACEGSHYCVATGRVCALCLTCRLATHIRNETNIRIIYDFQKYPSVGGGGGFKRSRAHVITSKYIYLQIMYI